MKTTRNFHNRIYISLSSGKGTEPLNSSLTFKSDTRWITVFDEGGCWSEAPPHGPSNPCPKSCEVNFISAKKSMKDLHTHGLRISERNILSIYFLCKNYNFRVRLRWFIARGYVRVSICHCSLATRCIARTAWSLSKSLWYPFNRGKERRHFFQQPLAARL